MRIAVLHNAVPADAPLEDQDTLVQVEAVRGALGRLDHETTVVPCTLDLAAMRAELLRLQPDVIFNLVETLANADSLMWVPLAVLDVLAIPYAGSHTEAMFLTTHKLLAKRQIHQAGLPTPAWIDHSSRHTPCAVASDPSVPGWIDSSASSPSSPSCSSCSSWILKGVWEHGSRGLDDEAVLIGVTLPELYERTAERARRCGRPSFAEQFIDGREFAVTVLAGPDGPQALLPAEIDFSTFPAGKPRIVGYRAKWREECFEYHHTPRRFDFDPSDRPLLDRLRDLSTACWRLFDLRGWARVDFRVDAAGEPWILEVNANPCLSPDAGFAAALDRSSIPFDLAVERILNDALKDGVRGCAAEATSPTSEASATKPPSSPCRS